jgi:hypothetical protein
VYIGGSAKRIEVVPTQPQLLEAIVRMYDGTGTERWTQVFGATGTDAVYGVSSCGAGAVCVAGVTEGTLAGQTSSERADAFVKVLAP